ncbi:MAG: hypothetical protein Q4B28_02190 [bacterium]|nr:hypothetical protein [bacterium]
MHKSGIALVLGLFTLIIGNISFALESQWKPFRSCIAMTTILDQYVKQGITPSQASDQVVRFHAPVSQSFLGTRDQESGILSIIKGAKDPQSLTINVDTSKIVSKFRLPQSWEGVHTTFYQDRLLLIVGYEQELSHLLIYSWDGKAFKPLKYFTFTGQLGTFEMIQDRLLLTTHQAVTQEGLQHIIQKH